MRIDLRREVEPDEQRDERRERRVERVAARRADEQERQLLQHRESRPRRAGRRSTASAREGLRPDSRRNRMPMISASSTKTTPIESSARADHRERVVRSLAEPLRHRADAGGAVEGDDRRREEGGADPDRDDEVADDHPDPEDVVVHVAGELAKGHAQRADGADRRAEQGDERDDAGDREAGRRLDRRRVDEAVFSEKTRDGGIHHLDEGVEDVGVVGEPERGDREAQEDAREQAEHGAIADAVGEHRAAACRGRAGTRAPV